MANTITSGVKITVDTSDIDVKFLKSIEELNAGLTKNQKALRLSYNEHGLLVNALGQCVESLSQSQIKMGQYVDELGRVHTFQGGFIEGLNKAQIAMGQYTDELGNIYNAAGDLIGQTNKLTKELEREAAAAKDTSDNLKGSKSSEIGGIFQTITDGATGSADSILNLKEQFEKLTNAGDFLKNIQGNLTNLPNLANQAGAAIGKLIKILGGKGFILGGIAAAIIELSNIGSRSSILKTLPDDLKEIGSRAYDAGERLKTLSDVLKHGAFSQSHSELGKAADELSRLTNEGLTKEQSEAVRDSWNGVSAAINEACFHLDNFLSSKNFKQEKAEQWATINNKVAELIESKKTDEEKINDEIQDWSKIANLISDPTQLEYIKEHIDALKDSLKDVEKQKAQQEKEKYENKLGVDFDAAPKKNALESYAENVVELQNLLNQGKINQDEFNTAQQQLKDAAQSCIPGLEEARAAAEEEKTAQERHAEELQRIAEAYATGALSESDRQAMLDKAAKDLANAQEARASELGIDSLISEAQALKDAQKTAFERWDEQEKAIEEAYKNHEISEEKYIKGTQALAELRINETAKEQEQMAQEQEQYAKDIGVDALVSQAQGIEEAKKTEEQKLTEKYREIREAYEQGKITEEKLLAGTEALKKIRKENARKEEEAKKEEKEKAKEGMRSQLGVDSLLEEMKTPLQKYQETMATIEEASKKRAITREERAMLEAQAEDKYWETIEGAGQKTAEAAEKMEEIKLGKSMKSGGEDLYLAMVKNASNTYQTRIQQNTERMRALQEQSLYQSQQTNYYLSTMITAQASTFYGA